MASSSQTGRFLVKEGAAGSSAGGRMAECLATQSTVKTVFALSQQHFQRCSTTVIVCEVGSAHLRDCGLNITKETAVLLLFCLSDMWRRT